MKYRLVRKYPVVVCLLLTATYTNLASADWSVDPSKRGHNQAYGDFPPADINKQLFAHLRTENQAENNLSQQNNDSALSRSKQAGVPVTQNYPAYNYQQPNYGTYGRGGRYQQNAMPGNYPNMNYGGPWNNNGSNFSGPWNNNGSNFSMPWGNNNGSGFSPMGNGSGWR